MSDADAAAVVVEEDTGAAGRVKQTREQDDRCRGEFVCDGVDDPEADEAVVAGWACRYDRPFLKWGYEDYEFWRVHENDCFRESIGQNPDVYLALNHENSFARTAAGTLKVENRSGEGVYFEASVSKENPEALAMLVEMRRGTLEQASIAYQVPADGYRMERQTRSDGVTVETQFIHRALLDHGDVSVCLYGANPDASSWRVGDSAGPGWLPPEARETLASLYPEGDPAAEPGENQHQPPGETGAGGRNPPPEPKPLVESLKDLDDEDGPAEDSPAGAARTPLVQPDLGRLASYVLQWRQSRRTRVSQASTPAA